MIAAESPSNITQWRSSSAANWTALRQARASMSATDEDSRVGVHRAPRETPRQSRTMTPIPAQLVCLKRAASKFTLTMLSCVCSIRLGWSILARFYNELWFFILFFLFCKIFYVFFFFFFCKVGPKIIFWGWRFM